MKPKANLRILLICASVLAGAITYTAHAASQTWDGGGADANWNTLLNWVGGAAPGDTTGGLVSTDVATFNAAIANTWGAPGTPIVIDNGSQNLGGINFDTSADSYTIGSTGGYELMLSSGGTIQILSTLTAANRTETINCPLAIEGADGTYTIANFSANGTGAGAGTLVIGGVVFGDAAGATVLTLDGNNTNANTISGIIEEGVATTMGITKNGTGTWNLTGANAFAGPVAVNSGTLAFGAVTLDSTANPSQTLTLGNTATLIFGSGDGAVTVNEPGLTGTGTVNLVGLGTKTLTDLGASYDGNIVISAGPPAAANPDANSGDVTVTAGSDTAYGDAVGTTTINNTGAGRIFVGKNPYSATTPAENFVINAGAGYVILACNSVFNLIRGGNFQINSGTVVFDNGGYGTTDSGVWSGNGGIMVINPGDVFTGANTFQGGASVGTGTNLHGFYGITQGITVGGSDTLSGGAILNGPLGIGPLILNVASASWPGTGRFADNGQSTTTLHCNVVQVNNVNIASQPGGVSPVTTAPNTMTFTDAGLTVPSTWTLKPNPNVWSNVARDDVNGIPGTSGSQVPLIQYVNVNQNYTLNIDEVIQENMGATPGHMTFRKIGLGTANLDRQSTYGGDTMAMQGTLKLGVNNALPNTTLLLGGGTYAAATWPELGLVPANGTSVLISGTTVNGTLDLNGFNQTVSGMGQASDNGAPTANVVTDSSGTTSTFTVNTAVANSCGATISGNLNLVMEGSGSLSGITPTYTGNTTVNGGTLSLDAINPNSSGSTVTIASSGATLDLFFIGTQTVAKLFIGATQMPPGVYGPSATSIPQITSSVGGTLTVVPPAPPTPVLPPSAFSMPGGVPTVTGISTVAGYTYWLDWKNNLTDASWTRITPGQAGGGLLNFTDPSPDPTHRFYRIEVQ